MRVFSLLLLILVAVIAQGKRFIVRLDDMEDWNHSDIQASLLTFFMNNSIAVTAGIIGNFFTGADVPLYNTLTRCANLGKDKCALFNHGADAVYLFGNSDNVSNQVAQMKICDDRVRLLFSNYQMEVFVPNQNSWNQYTMQAAAHLGYTLISASTLPYSGMTYDLTTNPLKMPQQTTTGYIGASEAWVAYHQNQTVADCVAADARGEVCVIMMHPHEFASGAYTLTMLSQLMDMLFAAGFESTNFHQIIMEAKGLTNPPSAAPTQKVQSTAVPSANPTQGPSVSNSRETQAPSTPVKATTDSSSSNKSGNLFLDPPVYMIIVYAVAALILILIAYILLPRYYFFPSNRLIRLSSKSDDSTDYDVESVEISRSEDEEKYLPSPPRKQQSINFQFDNRALPLPPPANHNSVRTSSVLTEAV